MVGAVKNTDGSLRADTFLGGIVLATPPVVELVMFAKKKKAVRGILTADSFLVSFGGLFAIFFADFLCFFAVVVIGG